MQKKFSIEVFFNFPKHFDYNTEQTLLKALIFFVNNCFIFQHTVLVQSLG